MITIMYVWGNLLAKRLFLMNQYNRLLLHFCLLHLDNLCSVITLWVRYVFLDSEYSQYIIVMGFWNDLQLLEYTCMSSNPNTLCVIKQLIYNFIEMYSPLTIFTILELSIVGEKRKYSCVWITRNPW